MFAQPLAASAPPRPPPPPTPPPTTPPTVATDGNVFFAFEETLKLFPDAAQSIALERKTGTPAHWMITDRPRTANELYAAIRRIHGRREETTYEVTFRDRGGRGSGGTVSMPSTMDELPPQGTPSYPQPPTAFSPAPFAPYAPPPVAYGAPPAAYSPPGVPPDFFALQRQMLEMLQTMKPQGHAPPPSPAVTAPAAPPPDPFASLLAAQRQTLEMMQQMAAPAPIAPPSAAAPPSAPAATPADPFAAMLAVQKQVFEMMQAMQSAAGGHPPSAVPAPVAAAPQTTTDMSAAFSMQREMFNMMMSMMQAFQRGTGPHRDPRDPGAPPTPYGGPAPYGAPRAPYVPPMRPKTPTQELRDAVSTLRDMQHIVSDLGLGGGAPEPAPEPDDSPIRTIDMGAAKGVINRSDGSLRGVETVMANLPDILKWVGEQRATIVKEREERQRQQQQQLPPGYVAVGPGYVPPAGYVAIPVDQIPQGAPPSEETLPEAPDDMPPPIDAAEPRTPWGMPTRQGDGR